jgi:hypothetical protein
MAHLELHVYIINRCTIKIKNKILSEFFLPYQDLLCVDSKIQIISLVSFRKEIVFERTSRVRGKVLVK